MKEALSVISSAWAVAFIVTFILWAIAPIEHDVWMTMFLLVSAVTGTGWLVYRFELKRKARKDDEQA